MKKGDIYTVISDSDCLVYVGIAMNDADAEGNFQGMQLSMSVWRENEDARLSMVTNSFYKVGDPNSVQVELLKPFAKLPSAEDLDAVASEQHAAEATNG